MCHFPFSFFGFFFFSLSHSLSLSLTYTLNFLFISARQIYSFKNQTYQLSNQLENVVIYCEIIVCVCVVNSGIKIPFSFSFVPHFFGTLLSTHKIFHLQNDDNFFFSVCAAGCVCVCVCVCVVAVGFFFLRSVLFSKIDQIHTKWVCLLLIRDFHFCDTFHRNFHFEKQNNKRKSIYEPLNNYQTIKAQRSNRKFLIKFAK